MGSQTIDLAVFTMLVLTAICFLAAVVLFGLYLREHKKAEQLEITRERFLRELRRCVRKACIVPVRIIYGLVRYAIQDVADSLYYLGATNSTYVPHAIGAMLFDSPREAFTFAQVDLAYTYVSLEKVPR